MVNYYLEKGFVILEHNSKHLISVPNEAKQRVRASHIQKPYFLLECYTEISSVANNINKFHIQYNFHCVYIHNFCNYKQEVFDDLSYRYHPPLLKYVDYPTLIQ